MVRRDCSIDLGRRRYPLAAIFLLALAFPSGSTAQSESGCRDPLSIEDLDFTRHIEVLSSPALCITEQHIEENDRDWHVITIRNTEMSGPLWAVPHDEEDVAFTSAIDAVLRYGGVVVAIENGENRNIDGIDPNHAFALTQEAAAICETVGAPSPRYVEAFLDPWDRAFPVIGLHSNWDGFADEGGLGTISVRRLDDKMIPFASPVAEGRFADEDTIAMLVSETLPAENESGRAAIDWLNANGVHVIYRHVTSDNNGCTLADFMTLNRLGPYFNLEVEHGDVETQPVLIDRLMEFLASDAYRGML